MDMKKVTYIAIAAALAIAAAGGAAYATTNDNGEQAAPLSHGQPFVFGLGQQPAGTEDFFSVRARAVPTPPGKALAAAAGYMSFEATPTELWDVAVTCVQITGNDAIVTGIARIPAQHAGEHVVLEAVDNDASGGTDQMRFSFQHDGAVAPGTPRNCWKPILSPVDIQSGFIEVIPAGSGS
jgi:hypothetical protein